MITCLVHPDMLYTRVDDYYFRGNLVISELLIIANLKCITHLICSDFHREFKLAFERAVMSCHSFTLGKLRHVDVRWTAPCFPIEITFPLHVIDELGAHSVN